MEGRGADGVARGRHPCSRSTGWRTRPAYTFVIFVAAVVMATINSIDAGASGSELRTHHPRQQARTRRGAGPEERRARSATEASWAGVAPPPLWIWRHLDTVPRRLDAAEGRLARIEALIELRLDQMVEGERSRNAKEDLWRDQESRRIEVSFDRLERRLAYMETRLADAATADRVATAAAAPRLQEQLRCQQEKLEESVEGVRRAVVEVVPRAVAAAIADKIKVPGMSLTPTSTPNINSHPPSSLPSAPCPSSEEQVENISKQASDTLEHLKQKLSEEFGLQAEKFVSKVGNMYNDLWQRAQSIETLLKDALVLGNSTQRDLHEGFRALVQQQQEQLQKLQQHSFQVQRERHGSAPNRRQGGASPHGQHSSQNRDSGKGEWSAGEALELGLGSLELSVDTLSGTLARRFGELGRRLDSSFRMLLLAQNLFLESCHRIQLGEPTLEARLSIVLERLLDTVSNRSQGLNHEAVEIKEALHSQTNQIAIMMDELENAITTVIREGHEWLSAEFMGENQRIKDEVLSLAKTVNSEEAKPELCSLQHENTNETANGASDGEHTKEERWSEISSDISEQEFEFHHVSAVVKGTDTSENISVIASIQKKQPESNLRVETTNATKGLEIYIEKHSPTGKATLNDINESNITQELTERAANDSQVNKTFSKHKEINASIDHKDLILDHEIPTTTNANANAYDLALRVESKISAENTTEGEVNSMETHSEGNIEMIQLQAILGALTDQASALKLKNITEIPDVRTNISSIEEMKLLLKDVILQIASDRNNVKDMKFNKTVDSALDDTNLSHFIKAVFKIYKSQSLDLNLENLKAKISKEINIGEDIENIPESNTENENILRLKGEQEFNNTEAIIASYVKKIINLASKLDSSSSDSHL